MMDKTFDLYHGSAYILAMCSVRYALGRANSVVQEVISIVREMVEDFTPGERATILYDIKQHLAIEDCYERASWENLAEFIEKAGA